MQSVDTCSSCIFVSLIDVHVNTCMHVDVPPSPCRSSCRPPTCALSCWCAGPQPLLFVCRFPFLLVRRCPVLLVCRLPLLLVCRLPLLMVSAPSPHGVPAPSWCAGSLSSCVPAPTPLGVCVDALSSWCAGDTCEFIWLILNNPSTQLMICFGFFGGTSEVRAVHVQLHWSRRPEC